MKLVRQSFAALCCVLLAAAPASLNAQNKDVESVVSASPVDESRRPVVSIGLDLSTGRYGDVDATRTLIVPLSLRVPVGTSLAFTASIAHVQISGPNVVIGPDGGAIAGIGGSRATRSGMGDLTLSGYWDVPMTSDHWSIQASARVKLPTSSKSNGFSTGKADFAGKVEATYITGKWAPFASLEYQVIGKPENLELQNSINSSVGFAWVSGGNAIIASYDFSQSTSPFIDDGHSLFAAYSLPVSERIRLTLYGIKGLSDGSADIQGGASASLRF